MLILIAVLKICCLIIPIPQPEMWSISCQFWWCWILLLYSLLGQGLEFPSMTFASSKHLSFPVGKETPARQVKEWVGLLPPHSLKPLWCLRTHTRTSWAGERVCMCMWSRPSRRWDAHHVTEIGVVLDGPQRAVGQMQIHSTEIKRKWRVRFFTSSSIMWDAKGLPGPVHQLLEWQLQWLGTSLCVKPVGRVPIFLLLSFVSSLSAKPRFPYRIAGSFALLVGSDLRTGYIVRIQTEEKNFSFHRIPWQSHLCWEGQMASRTLGNAMEASFSSTAFWHGFRGLLVTSHYWFTLWTFWSCIHLSFPVFTRFRVSSSQVSWTWFLLTTWVAKGRKH